MFTTKEFRKLLLEIQDKLTDEDKDNFCFAIADDVPKNLLKSPLIKIFEALIERNKLGPDNLTRLIEVLECIYREDLVYDINKKIGALSAAPIQTLETASLQPHVIQPQLNARLFYELLADQDKDTLHQTDDAVLPVEEDQQQQQHSVDVSRYSDANEIPLNYDEIDLQMFESDTWTDEFLQQINIKIRPYNYQIELIQSAIKAQNTLICLRTGAGKTYVSAILLKYYFIKKMKTNPGKFLSFFFVPRRSILRQQADALRTVQNLRIVVCDEDSEVKKYVPANYDVIVCTPQKLVNCLKDKAISLNDVDMMIFDECHNSVKNHPYCQIMQYLLCSQNFSLFPRIERPPIILGLTASIGLRGSSNLPVIHNLVVLCATLNCLTICAVTKPSNEQELKERISYPTDDEIFAVDSGIIDEKLSRDMKNLICSIFNHHNPSKLYPDKDVGANGYEQNIVLMQQTAQKLQDFPSVIMLTYVIALSRRLQALYDLPSNLVLSDLNEHFDIFYKKKEDPIQLDTDIYNRCKRMFDEKLKSLARSAKILTNPKLDVVINLLVKHATNPDSRGLILVQRTFYAKKISDYLKGHPQIENIIRPDWLVGQSSSDYTKTSNEQDLTLKNFRDGKCNVMVSTDVVQEGLDVAQCSYVIRYEFVSDEIGTVQARGRARAKDSSYYLITTKESPNHEKEKGNRARELEMMDALEKWKKMEFEEFKGKILVQQEQLVGSWLDTLNKSLTRLQMQKSSSLDGTIQCRFCGHILGELAWLRTRGTMYLVYNPLFLEKIEFSQREQPLIKKEIKINGKALCGNKECRVELGGLQNLLDRPDLGEMCALRCEAIKINVIENGEEQIILTKKWSDLPISVPPLETFYDRNGINVDHICKLLENSPRHKDAFITWITSLKNISKRATLKQIFDELDKRNAFNRDPNVLDTIFKGIGRYDLAQLSSPKPPDECSVSDIECFKIRHPEPEKSSEVPERYLTGPEAETLHS
ncbi:unnamed protein product [Didymodactylos carnosus]|uniref:RNA helicase n=1 Tax=Didymodactylos carnosus TaxID=1234261 RepID=A0A814GGM9_9BILA|nr:unnamed protein product [Didymodactylos carnosus]CAF3767754.1 unnamed protein product [Didymodactylos carnosus]